MESEIIDIKNYREKIQNRCTCYDFRGTDSLNKLLSVSINDLLKAK